MEKTEGENHSEVNRMGNTQNILEGRVAIVTGSGRGVGRAIAAKLAESGARVVACDIDENSAKETAD